MRPPYPPLASQRRLSFPSIAATQNRVRHPIKSCTTSMLFRGVAVYRNESVDRRWIFGWDDHQTKRLDNQYCVCQATRVQPCSTFKLLCLTDVKTQTVVKKISVVFSFRVNRCQTTVPTCVTHSFRMAHFANHETDVNRLRSYFSKNVFALF